MVGERVIRNATPLVAEYSLASCHSCLNSS